MKNAVVGIMKNLKSAGVLMIAAWPLFSVVAQAPVAPPPESAPQVQGAGTVPTDLSPGVTEIIRLAESGSSEDVILAYIKNSQATYNLSADHVVYLKDVGLSPQVISTML